MTQNRVVSTLGDSSFAGKNGVLNGAFDVWSKGTSVVAGNATYVVDRWLTYVDSATNRTVIRQATGDTTNLPNIQYCARFQRTAGDTSTGRLVLGQGFETINSIPYAGQTVTLSFYARAGANFSSTSSALGVILQYGTGTDQNIFVGYTGNTNLVSDTKTLTTTWQRFTLTGTVPTSSTELGFQFYYTPTGTAGAADYFEITGVQLEEGSVATSFTRSGGTAQGEITATAGIDVTGNINSTSIGNMASYQVAGKNAVINGAFDFWQRGTSISNPASGLVNLADRWMLVWDGSGATRTVSQQVFTTGAAGNPTGAINGRNYFLRYAQSVAGTGANYNLIEQRIEGAIWAGQTVTLSFWAKAATAFTMAAIDYEYTVGGTNIGASIAAGPALTTSWQKFSYTFTLPTYSGLTPNNSSDYVGIRLWVPTNTTFTLDLWGVQLELGSLATQFSRAGGTLQGELAACQRYYFRQTSNATNGAAVPIATGVAGSTTALYAVMHYPVTMRATPTSVDFANINTWQGGGLIAISNVVLTSNSVGTDKTLLTCTTTGLTNTQSYGVLTNSGGVSGYIGLSAEFT